MEQAETSRAIQPPQQRGASADSAGAAALADSAPVQRLGLAAQLLNASPAVVAQRAHAAQLAARAPVAQRAPQPLANHTGLPDGLKAGVEALSGIAMDDVRVHRNSGRPAQLQAHAYAQGSDIHLAPGQEQHLPHEAWHVVQQKQGRVQATMQLKAGVPINDDAVLEQEADMMGARAAGIGASESIAKVQRVAVPVVMRRVDPDYDTVQGATPVTKASMSDFYDQFVGPEVERFKSRPVQPDIKQEMVSADLYFSLFLMNSPDVAAIHRKLNTLIEKVNAAADNWDAQKGDPDGGQNEDSYRTERRRRAGAKTRAGTTQPRDVRGFDSHREADALLKQLRGRLTGVLAGAFALGHVGIRGSAVTGIRSRTQTPFEDATADHEDAGQASDIDFFFTSQGLEAQIRATQNVLPAGRRINAGGTMNAQYLHRWLTNCPPPGNGYANAARLAAALQAFTNAATARTGRKCDVTFVGGNTAAAIVGDAGTLIL